MLDERTGDTQNASQYDEPDRDTKEKWRGRITVASLYKLGEDGQRFLMIQLGEPEATNQTNVVLNWFEELKRLVPDQN